MFLLTLKSCILKARQEGTKGTQVQGAGIVYGNTHLRNTDSSWGKIGLGLNWVHTPDILR